MTKDVNVSDKIDLFKSRFIFSRYRFHLRKLVGPFFFSFVLLDYWYMPENALRWGIYRAIYLVIILVGFIPIVKYRKVRLQLEKISCLVTVLACNVVNLMIYESGGYSSKYFIGVILCAVAGTQLFKQNRFYGFVTQAFSFIPLIFITLSSVDVGVDLKNAIIQSLFLIGMAVLTYIFGSSEDSNTAVLLKIKDKMRRELEKMQKTENLKRFFPIVIRNEIENNPSVIGKKKKMKNIIIGFADIVNSTQIANKIDIELDWELKENFLEAATALALKNDLVVLTHLGDGFLFVVNYMESESWQDNLFSFYSGLTREYERIYSNIVGISGSVKSGVKFGLARGDVIIGFLGKDQAYFTAVGPTVNLASRVCSKATGDELIVTEDLWVDLAAFAGGLTSTRIDNSELKGFSSTWTLVRISKLKSGDAAAIASLCEDCGAEMKLEEGRDGILDYVCSKCFSNEKAS